MKKGIPGIKKQLKYSAKSSPAIKSELASSAKVPPGSRFHGLIASMNDSELKLHEDDNVVIIKDKYPKARFHYLVLPKTDISQISKVTKDDLELLKYMETIARTYADKNKEYKFQLGYHQVPSMNRLHLHVISTDFDSPSLKTKQHWNSFTTPFFLLSEDAIKQLEENGEIKINRNECQAYLKKELKCHKCSYTPKNLPDLKKHILVHIP